MRFSFAILAAAIASTSATALYPRQLPACATSCLASADQGDCAQNDNSCLCKNDAFVSSTTACITKDCKGDDLQAAFAAAQALCLQVGVTLAPPTPTGTGTTNGTGAPEPTGTTPNSSETGTGAPKPTGTGAPAPGTNGTSTNGTAGNGTTPSGNGTSAPAPTGSSAAMANTLSTLAGVAAFGLAALAL